MENLEHSIKGKSSTSYYPRTLEHLVLSCYSASLLNNCGLATVSLATVSLATVSLATVPLATVSLATVSLATVSLTTVSLATVLLATVSLATVSLTTVLLATCIMLVITAEVIHGIDETLWIGQNLKGRETPHRSWWGSYICFTNN
jgi:hypothetical protein